MKVGKRHKLPVLAKGKLGSDPVMPMWLRPLAAAKGAKRVEASSSHHTRKGCFFSFLCVCEMMGVN